MHDIHTAIVGLVAARKQAGAAADIAQFLAPLDAAPGAGIAGALIDHLVWHADDSASEMRLLRRSHGIWSRLLAAIGALRSARSALEAGVADPTDFAKAKAAIGAAAQLRDELLPGIATLGESVTKFVQDLGTTDFIPEHAQAHDLPVDDWSAVDLLAGRRTAALRLELLQAAAVHGTSAQSFAVGAVAAYATRHAAGAYRNVVVGGPPRNHRYRSRLAARTIGAWLHKQGPVGAMPLSQVAALLRKELGDALPLALADTVNTAWKQTFAALGTVPTLDLEHGYIVLLRQLDMLSSLTLAGPSGTSVPGSSGSGLVAPPPVTPGLAGSTSGSPGLQPQGGAGGWGAGGGTGGQGGPVKVSGSGKFSWKSLLAALLTIVLGVLGGIFGGPLGAGAGILAGVGFGAAIDAWKVNEVQVNAAGTFSQALTGSDAGQLCHELFLLDVQLFTLATGLLQALKVGGVAYPDSYDLTAYPFAQFTAVPTDEYVLRRSMADPFEHLVFPTSPVELPTPGGVGLPVGTSPAAALGTAFTLRLWHSIAGGDAAWLRRENYQIDADRGAGMPCWKGVTKTDPVQVSLLNYHAV